MKNLFLNIDCMDPEQGLPSYWSEASVIISDPPYGIDYQSSRRTDKDKRFKKITGDKEPFIEWIPSAYDALSEGGRLFVFHRWDVANIFKEALLDSGFNVVWDLIWDKATHGMGDLKASPAPQHENIWYCTKGRYEFKGPRPKTIIRTPRVSPEKMIHPNEKPINLYKSLLRDYATPGELIVDPFCGASNSIRACQEMDFNYIGYEIDKDYYNAAKNRMSKGIQKVMF